MLDKILEMQIRRSRETRGCISYCLLSRPYDHMLKMLLKCIEFFFNFRRKIGKRISQIINRNIYIQFKRIKSLIKINFSGFKVARVEE